MGRRFANQQSQLPQQLSSTQSELRQRANRDQVLRGIVAKAPRFLFVIDWEQPEHGFLIVSRFDGLLRREYVG